MKSPVKHLNVFIISFLYWESFMRKVALVVDLDEGIANRLVSFKGTGSDNAHERRLSLQNKFVGSTLNSKSPLPLQSLKILRFIRTSVALAGLVIFR